MKQASIKELNAIVTTLNYGEEITYFNDVVDGEGADAYGIARLHLHDADMLLINYLGGGSPCVIDITWGNDLESQLLSYVLDGRPTPKEPATPENTFVYLAEGVVGPVCDCGCNEFECTMLTRALVHITTEFGDPVHTLGSEDVQSNDYLGPYTCINCGATYQSINFNGEGGEDDA